MGIKPESLCWRCGSLCDGCPERRDAGLPAGLADRLRPLSDLPAEVLAELRGVLTDIDDTLTRDGAIEAEALAALHALSRAGLPVIAVTGRPVGWSEPFAMQWPVAAIVAGTAR
jgi:hypothetical protein